MRTSGMEPTTFRFSGELSPAWTHQPQHYNTTTLQHYNTTNSQTQESGGVVVIIWSSIVFDII